jgi:hypothetical protein
MNIQIDFDTTKLSGHLDDLKRKQLPFATKNALNSLTFGVQQTLRSGVDRWVEGGAVPFTKSGIQVHKASKRSLYAAIFFPDNRPYMRTMVFGGTRKPLKRNKKLLVPGYDKSGKSAQRLNKRGNIARNTIGSIMSRSGQNFMGPVKRESNTYKRKSAKPRTHFIGKPKGQEHRPLGLYKTFKNKGPKLLIAMDEKQMTYKRIWPANEIGINYVQKHHRHVFGKALGQAIATAIPRVIDSTGY